MFVSIIFLMESINDKLIFMFMTKYVRGGGHIANLQGSFSSWVNEILHATSHI